MNAKQEQQQNQPLIPSPTALSFAGAIAFPLKVLWVGNFNVLLYFALTAVLSVKVATILASAVATLLASAISEGVFVKFIPWASAIVYLLAVPFVVIGMGIPIKVLWLHDGFKFAGLFEQSRASISKFPVAIRYSWRLPIISALPLAAALIMNRILSTQQFDENVSYLIIVIIAVTGLIAAYKLTEWLFTLFVATFVEVDPITALQYSKRILKERMLSVFFTSVIGFGSVLLCVYTQSISDEMPRVILACLLAWYTLSVMVVLALEASESLVQKEGKTFRTIHQA